MQIFVKTIPDKTYVIQLPSTNTFVQNIKEEIALTQAIPIEQQTLYYNGKLLMDKLTLAEQHIPDQAMLHLLLRLRGGGIDSSKLELYIKLYDKRTVTIQVHSEDTIAQVIEHIYQQYNLSGTSSLAFTHTILQNTKNLADYNIKDQDTLILLPRLQQWITC